MSGIVNSYVQLGSKVQEDDVIGMVTSPYGNEKEAISARISGIVIGMRTLPLVYKGEALYHIASFDSPEYIAQRTSLYQYELEMDIGMEEMK